MGASELLRFVSRSAASAIHEAIVRIARTRDLDWPSHETGRRATAIIAITLSEHSDRPILELFNGAEVAPARA